MKKIGILTFHNADNLGAVLQAYALQKTLEDKCNVSAEIVDYRCDAIEKSKRVNKSAGLKNTLKSLPKSVYYKIKRKGFDSFRRKLKKSDRVYKRENVKDCNDVYDMILCGSDQIWNMECSGGDYTYFADFAPAKQKKAAYAASIGEYCFSENEAQKIRELLARFDCVSVREASAADKLKAIGVEDVCVLSDPVALLDAKQWKDLMKPRLYNKKYVLVYLIKNDDNVVRFAEEYAKKNNCKLINNKKSLEFILNNSPQAFLSWVYYADCVFTNSFHGTMFSLLFEKRLAAYTENESGKVNGRVLGLLKKTGAETCVLTAENPAGNICNVKDNIERMREQGISYLRRICE